MKDFSLISNEILKGIHTKENPSRHEKSRNDGFLLIPNEILEGIHIKKNPSESWKSLNEGFPFNF